MDSKINIKCVLLGDSSVGKTCLVSRFLRDEFKNNTAPTIGTAFGIKTVQSKLDNGKIVTHDVGVWDTAGSERYYSMTQHYYRNTNIALVCYDLTNRKTWDKVSFWVTELRKVEPGAMISIIGTKSDLVQVASRSVGSLISPSRCSRSQRSSHFFTSRQQGGKPRCVSSSAAMAYASEVGALTFEASALAGDNVNLAFGTSVTAFCNKNPNFGQETDAMGNVITGKRLERKTRSNGSESKKCAC
mmetsp:Transcript_11304/g.27820  ORF Transcript_11304/g.27820 Transcript_11304/m.27820 type:complete len:244 (-) Transcript_11304:320-1051(-)